MTEVDAAVAAADVQNRDAVAAERRVELPGRGVADDGGVVVRAVERAADDEDVAATVDRDVMGIVVRRQNRRRDDAAGAEIGVQLPAGVEAHEGEVVVRPVEEIRRDDEAASAIRGDGNADGCAGRPRRAERGVEIHRRDAVLAEARVDLPVGQIAHQRNLISAAGIARHAGNDEAVLRPHCHVEADVVRAAEIGGDDAVAEHRGGDRRGIVGAADGQGDGGDRAGAARVLDDIGEAVGAALAHRQILEAGTRRIGDLAGFRVEGHRRALGRGDGENRPCQRIDAVIRGQADHCQINRVTDVDVGVVGEKIAGVEAEAGILISRRLERRADGVVHRHGSVVRARHGEGQRHRVGGCGVAAGGVDPVGQSDRIGEAVGLAGRHEIDRRLRQVDRIGHLAVAVGADRRVRQDEGVEEGLLVGERDRGARSVRRGDRLGEVAGGIDVAGRVVRPVEVRVGEAQRARLIDDQRGRIAGRVFLEGIGCGARARHAVEGHGVDVRRGRVGVRRAAPDGEGHAAEFDRVVQRSDRQRQRRGRRVVLAAGARPVIADRAARIARAGEIAGRIVTGGEGDRPHDRLDPEVGTRRGVAEADQKLRTNVRDDRDGARLGVGGKLHRNEAAVAVECDERARSVRQQDGPGGEEAEVVAIPRVVDLDLDQLVVEAVVRRRDKRIGKGAERTLLIAAGCIAVVGAVGVQIDVVGHRFGSVFAWGDWLLTAGLQPHPNFTGSIDFFRLGEFSHTHTVCGAARNTIASPNPTNTSELGFLGGAGSTYSCFMVSSTPNRRAETRSEARFFTTSLFLFE